MKKPRVLLTGPDWFGELVPFCARALEALNAEVRVGITHAYPDAEARHWWNGRFRNVPFFGWRIQNRMQQKTWQQNLDAAVGNFRAVMDGWRPDLVISLVQWGDWILNPMLQELGDVPKVGWLMDDPFQTDQQLVHCLPLFDRLYVIDETWSTAIRSMLATPVSTLTCGADLSVQRPLPTEEVPESVRSGIVFIGSSYASSATGFVRRSILEHLIDLDLAIYGDRNWTASGLVSGCYRGGPVDAVQANRIYNGARIALNIHHPQFKEGTSLRTFGICASGAFQLVDWRPGLDRYFEPDEELVVFRTPDELREKAEYYLRNEAARGKIARAGYERVRREHRYTDRLRVILHDMDMLPREAPQVAVPAS
jgi:spore maturation protein CgeB